MDLSEVVDVAQKFVNSLGYIYSKVTKILPDETQRQWNVSVNISVMGEKILTIVISDKNGKVLALK